MIETFDKSVSHWEGWREYVAILTQNLQESDRLAIQMSKLLHLFKLKHLVVLFQNDKGLICMFLILFSVRKPSPAFCLISQFYTMHPTLCSWAPTRVWEAFTPTLIPRLGRVSITMVSTTLVALPADPKVPLNMAVTSILKDSSSLLLS